MQSINKIHINSSTELSLNDRFTMMQTTEAVEEPEMKLRRNVTSIRNNRSTSRPRSMPAITTSSPPMRGTPFRNRNLAQLLDLNQKIQAALRLKRRSIRRNVTPRQINERFRNRIAMNRIMNTIRVGPSGRLRRANSLTNIRTMRADQIGYGRIIRSNSSMDITARLGRRRQPNNINGPRRKLNRNNFSTLRRSASRQSLNRLNTDTAQRNSLRRFNSQTNLKRSLSRQNLQLAGQQQVQNKLRKRLLRSNSHTTRNRRLMNTTIGGQNRQIIRRNYRGNSQLRKNEPLLPGGSNVIRGRVFKRRLNTIDKQNMRSQPNQRGRSRSRVGRGQNNMNPNRSVSRGRMNRQGNNNSNNLQNRSRRNRNSNVTVQRRSRSRQRKGSAAFAKANSTKTREQLDKELEQYMVNTKPQSELDSLLGNI